MRRILRTWIAAVTFLGVLCVPGTSLRAQDQQDQKEVAMLVQVKGSMDYRAARGGEWEPAKAPMPLYTGNQLRTGTGDRGMIVYLTSGTRVLINENSEIEVSAEVAAPGQRSASERTGLIMGEIYNRVRSGSNYEVETPSSVASVRGTEFDAETDGTEDTFLGIEGSFSVTNEFGSVIVQQFQRTTVQEDQAPGNPADIPPDDANRQVSWTANVAPTWRLNLVPEGGEEHQIGEAFQVAVWAMRDGALDQDAVFPLTRFGADTGMIQYSTNNGRTWSSVAPTLTIVNGQAAVLCRITGEGSVILTAEATDAESAELSLTGQQPRERRTIRMRFQDEDGTEKTLIWELEEE